MKENNNSERTHYEILDVPSTASVEIIEQAYRKASSLYSGDNMALYSLYSSEERQEKLKQLTDIYETLRDPIKRKSYDEYVGRSVSPSAPAQWDMNIANTTKDVFDEYTEVGAFKDKLQFKAPLAVMDNKGSMVAERYRILYTRFEQISLRNSFKTFAVTSAVKGEGKTTTSLNLSYMMAAEFGKKVLLMESDFRNPSISSNYLRMGRQSGLVDVLKGEADLRSAITRYEDTNLYFLPARCSVKNSSILLDSANMSSVFKTVKADFDYIIVDSPPILPLVDMNILSRAVDALMLVVRAGSTPKDIVRKAVSSLPRKNVAGVVLNGADDIHLDKYYY